MNNIIAKAEVMTGKPLAWLLNIFFNMLKTRDDVLDFEAFVKQLPGAFTDCPYEYHHSFVGGMYRREVHFPAGHLIVGAIHATDYIVNVLSGRILIASEFGASEVLAGANFMAKKGVKHIGYTLEDTVWVDTYRTNTTTIEEAEKELYADSYAQYDRMCSLAGNTQQEIAAREVA